MLALERYRKTRCPHCRGDLDVTTDAKNEDRFKAELPVQCFRCLAFARSHDAYRDQPQPHTLLHLVPHEPR
jgi:hypothetical protein